MGVLLLLIGGGFSACTLFQGIMHVTDSLTQVVVPGRAELNLQQGLNDDVFLEQQSVGSGKVYSTTQSSIVGSECRVKSLQNDTSIAVQKLCAGPG
jgi:hypothetical protein